MEASMSFMLFWVATAGAADLDPELVRALSARDAVACEALLSDRQAPAADLLAVVDQITMPPWAAMRAGSCLVRHHGAEVQVQLAQWVVKPELKGLGWVVLDGLDHLPEPLAIELAQSALATGPDPDGARVRIAKSTRPALSSLVKP
jgi:hypothetical protein